MYRIIRTTTIENNKKIVEKSRVYVSAYIATNDEANKFMLEQIEKDKKYYLAPIFQFETPIYAERNILKNIFMYKFYENIITLQYEIKYFELNAEFIRNYQNNNNFKSVDDICIEIMKQVEKDKSAKYFEMSFDYENSDLLNKYKKEFEKRGFKFELRKYKEFGSNIDIPTIRIEW